MLSRSSRTFSRVAAMTRLRVRQDSDSTIVSVKVRGKDQSEFNQRLNGYLPESKGNRHPLRWLPPLRFRLHSDPGDQALSEAG